jgi:hypothetical protein
VGTRSARASTGRRRAAEIAALIGLEMAVRDHGLGDAGWRASVRIIGRHIGCSAVGLYLADRGRLELRASSKHGTHLGDELPSAEATPLNAAVLTGRPAIFLPRPRGTSPARPGPMICVPIRTRRGVSGLLVATDRRAGALDEADAWFLAEAARRIARWLDVDAAPPAAAAESSSGRHSAAAPAPRSVTLLEDPTAGESVASGAA